MFELTTVFALTFISNLVTKNGLMMFNTLQFATGLQPIMLVFLCAVLLYYIYYENRRQFAADYKYMTWQNEFRPMAPFVMLIIITTLFYGAYALQSDVIMHGGKRR
jgi:hypothetical protein